MNLEDMTVEQLKALWYDQFMHKAQAENNIALINRELSNRNQPASIAAVEEDELING